MIGRTLDHYRIESKLGEGGMGVVYLAHDTRLKRPVAIKVLHAESVAHPERKQRFVQEAQAASGLNHPNIITIYDIASAEGVDFIAMEYVAGQTLDRVIDRRGQQLGEALKYAIQIADALARAHNAGIVHRDLKPANIMVTPEGRVKVLDFGLAKLTEMDAGDESSATRSMTLEERPHTEEGVILGTVAYMSPEQAEGKRVDARSDIFSLGSVLYEMLTGCRPFQGESKISILTAILHQDPKPMSEISEGIPRQVEWIVGQCLRKDPGKRSQHMEDIKVSLEALKEESDSARLAVAPSAGAKRSAPAWWRALTIGALTLLLLAAGVGWQLGRKREPSRGPTITRLTADSGLTTDPALSPDGKLVAYASDRSGGNLDIWVQQVAGGEPIRLTTDPADDDEPAFSPDGSKIAFHSAREGGAGPGVYVASALGGEARLIARQGRRPRFSPDGSQIAYWVGAAGWSSGATPGSAKIFVVSAEGGSPREVQPEFDAARYPIWAPDGKHLLFLGLRDHRGAIEKNYDWWVVPLEAGPAVKTGAYEVFGGQAPVGGTSSPFTPAAWLPDPDRILFAGAFGANTNVWQVELPPRSGKIQGAARQLTFGTAIEAQPSAVSGLSGRTHLLFAALQSNSRGWSLGLDADNGKVTGQLQPVTQSDISPSLNLSSDGKKLVFASMQFRTSNTDIWLQDLETGKSVALTSTPAAEGYPVLSPDGSKAAYGIFGNKSPIYWIDVRGGIPEKVCDDCGAPWHWSSDGKKILYYWVNRKRLGLLDVASGEKTELLKHPSHSLAYPQFSPDGRWISFAVRTGAGRARLAAAPFHPGIIPEGDWIFLTDDFGWILHPCWSPNGARIYFSSDQDGFQCMWQQRLNPVTKRPLGPPSAVYHFHNARSALRGLTVAQGKAAFSILETTGNLWMSEWPGR